MKPRFFSIMPSLYFTPLSVLIMAIIIVIFSSCDKEHIAKTELQAMVKTNDPHRWYLNYAGSKAGEIRPRGAMLTVNQALEYLNDGMNFLYCRPDGNYLETVAAKDNFTVAATSGEIDEDDLINLMDEIAEFAGDSYYADTRTDKEPQLFDINLVTAGSSLVEFEVIFLHQGGEKLSVSDTYPYSDSWIYGQYGQDVSSLCSQEEANADAADLFRRDLRDNIVFRSKYEAYYFKNPYAVCFSGVGNNCEAAEIPANYLPADATIYESALDNTNDVTENDNYYDLLVFYNHSGNSGYHSCLTTNEMNFHYESMEDLALDILPNPVGNIVLAQIEVGYELLAGEETSTIFHSMLAVKATKTTITDEEHEDAIQLPN